MANVTYQGKASFGKSPEEIKQIIAERRRASIAEMIKASTGETDSPAQKFAKAAGAALGAGFGGALADKYAPDPELERAQQVQSAFDRADKAWKDDPAALPAANSANRLEAILSEAGPHMNADDRMSVLGQITALRSDAYNQSRLSTKDAQDAESHRADMAKAQVALANAKIDKDMKDRTFADGNVANEWVFKMPDGSMKYAGQGGYDFNNLMGMVNDHPEYGIEVLGLASDLQKHKNLMEEKSAMPVNPKFKFSDKQLGDFTDLDSMGNILGYLNSPAAAEGLSRLGGAAGLYDSARERVNAIPFVGELARYAGMDDVTPSSKVRVYVARLRGAQQSLIKGVPSNNDQYIYDLSNPQTNVSPKVNAIRLQLITDDAIARMRVAYSRAKGAIEQAGMTGRTAVPTSIVHALSQMGINTSDIGTEEEEQQKLEVATKRGTDIWDSIKASGGATPDTENEDYIDPATGEPPKRDKAGATGSYDNGPSAEKNQYKTSTGATIE